MRSEEDRLLRALHDAHAPALWGYVIGLTGGDRARAEDVVQETLLRAWRTPEILGQSPRSARGWLFTVAHRIVIDEWRSARRRNEFSADRLPESAVDDTDNVLQSWLVTEALGRLSASHRQALVECFYRGHSVNEAAERIGVPAGTVKSRLHYGLRALRLVLEEMGVSA